jgi:hypothetical protein
MLANWWDSIDRVAKGVYTVGFTLLLAGLMFSLNNQPVQAARVAPENQPDRKPGLRFDQEDTGICRIDSGWIEATVFVTLPEGVIARLQVAHHVVRPHKTDITYIDAGVVRNGDSYTFNAYWPGIQRGDKFVEIHWGAGLLDIQKGHLIETAGLDYFWYPYICKPFDEVEPTKIPQVTPTILPIPTDQPGFKPAPTKKVVVVITPSEQSRLPTLSPPIHPGEDIFAVLPETGTDFQAEARVTFLVYMGIILVGLGCCSGWIQSTHCDKVRKESGNKNNIK